MAAIAPAGSFPMAGGCYGGCCLETCCPGLADCLARGGVRTAYGITGGCPTDCLAGCCCGPCNTCQLVRWGMILPSNCI